MIFHNVALALVFIVSAHYVLAGDLTRWLLKAARADEAGQQLHNAAIAMFFVTLVWLGGTAALLLLPGIPTELETVFGLVIVVGVLVSAILRRSLNARPVLLVASGALVIVGNLI